MIPFSSSPGDDKGNSASPTGQAALRVGLGILATVLTLALASQLVARSHWGDGAKISVLLNRSTENERQLFQNKGVLHLNNAYFLYDSGPTNHTFRNAIPVSLPDPTGRRIQLPLPVPCGTSQVSEEVVYEPETGRYLRLFRIGVDLFHAVGFDGEAVYNWDWTDERQIQRQPIAASARSVCEPADLLGLCGGLPELLAASRKSELWSADEEATPVGKGLFVMKTAPSDALASDGGHWRLIVHEGDRVLQGIVRVERGREIFSIFRSRVEHLKAPRHAWNLSDLHIGMALFKGSRRSCPSH